MKQWTKPSIVAEYSQMDLNSNENSGDWSLWVRGFSGWINK